MQTEQNILPEFSKETFFLLDQLASENKKLIAENTKLTTTVDDLNTTVDDLNTTVDDLNVTLEDLKFQLAQLKRMIFGSKRERFESNEHPCQLTIPFDFGDEKIEEVIEADKQQISYERTKPSKPHPGR